jgi:hypothetical protein
MIWAFYGFSRNPEFLAMLLAGVLLSISLQQLFTQIFTLFYLKVGKSVGATLGIVLLVPLCFILRVPREMFATLEASDLCNFLIIVTIAGSLGAALNAKVTAGLKNNA